jgi:hypothetical protein
VPAVPAVPVVVGRAATITAAQKSGVWAFFAAHDAVRWSKTVKKERIQELMAMDAYRNLKVSQISRQLEGFVVSAQLREQVGSRMYVYTDTVLEVVDGMEPDPATAAALPFAEDHMLLILSELFLFLHHVGIPCFMPDMFLQFLRDCHAELVRRNNLPAGDDDLGTDPVLQHQIDSVSVWMMCCVLVVYRDAWEQLAAVELRAAGSSTATGVIGEMEFNLNERREAECSPGGALFILSALSGGWVANGSIGTCISNQTPFKKLRTPPRKTARFSPRLFSQDFGQRSKRKTFLERLIPNESTVFERCMRSPRS